MAGKKDSGQDLRKLKTNIEQGILNIEGKNTS